MRNFRWFMWFMMAVVLGSTGFGLWRPALAQEAASPEATVEEQMKALDQRLRILERRWELEQESAQAKAKETPILGAGKEGFSLKSADGRLSEEDKRQPGTDTFLLRRVRPIFEGTAFKDFDFRIMPDFGGGQTVLQDAYLGANFWPQARLRVGKFKAPFGLERLQSGTELSFVERALPTNLVPNRDLGIQLHGDLFAGTLGYALGVFNGVADGGSGDLDNHNDKDFVGRLFVQPFKYAAFGEKLNPLQGLGVGVAGSYGNQQGSASSPNLPSFKTPGQQTFFKYQSSVIADGIRYRLSPQGSYYWGPFGLLGEYVLSTQEVKKGATTARLRNDAWQVAVSYVLTGEKASYKGVAPLKPFELGKGRWGAFELVARYSVLEIDKDAFRVDQQGSPIFANPKTAARKARAWAIGFNWYLNRNVKFVLDYEQTDFQGGGARGDREDERFLLSRFQLSF